MACSAPVDSVPLVVCAPDQAPEAVHEAALVDSQFNVELPPLTTELGVALNVRVGGAAATVTVIDCVAEPPSPVQVSEKSVVLASAPVGCEPLMGIGPLQPPEASQEVAYWEFQVSVEFAPMPTVDGSAVSVTTGGETATTVTAVDCVAEPPGPSQVKLNWVDCDTVVDRLPEVGCGPLQPPEAMQLCAFLALQESVVDVPGTTEFALDCSVTWGTADALPLAFLVSSALPVPQALRASTPAHGRITQARRAIDLSIMSP